MRCPYCGTENPPDHRFCGMCGRPLVEIRGDDSATEPPAGRDPERPAPAPAYTGGLFNLNAPADKPYRSLDYLLEDDEEPRSNKGLILLCLIALVLAGGLGWLRWRNVNLPEWFKTHVSASKPSTPAASNSPNASANPSSADQANPSSSIQPVQAEEPAPSPSSANNATPPSPTAPSTANSGAPSTTPASPPTSATLPGDSNSAAAAAPPNSTPPPTGDSIIPASPAHTDKSDATPRALPAAPPAKPKPAPKPAPKPEPKAPDQVALGEQYLYGRGVPQNCEKGLRYVKPAADQSNTKAMITMGALYATGHCLSRDLPTAYRFFALALRSDPDNGPLRQNAEMVWKQMTAEERKQAIRMTQ